MSGQTILKIGIYAATLLVASGGAGKSPDSPAAADRPSSLDLPSRWRSCRPYDGSGRYTMQTDDGVRGVQGLFALAGRYGAKPYNGLSVATGVWQSERVIFRDVDTAAMLIRYTNDPWTDQLSYFRTSWSADGKHLVFRRRPGMWENSTPTHGPMAVRADGTELRNVFRDHRAVRNEVCSPTEPDVCYATTGDGHLVAFSLATGRQTRILRKISGGWHLKISPDGKYLMNRAETSKGKGFWIASVDGREFYEIAIPEGVHDSYCFHPSQKKVLFWREGKLYDEGFAQCEFDGANMTMIPVPFDWNHGDFGRDRGVHSGGYVTRVRGDAWLNPEPLFYSPKTETYDLPHHYNSYSAWQPKDGLWAFHTRIAANPYVSEIQAFPSEPAVDGAVNRYRVCLSALRPGRMLDNPNASPDGTKVAFNSNFLGSNNIFGVVTHLPEPPRDLHTRLADPGKPAAGVLLNWKPAQHHAETAGYHVYRSKTSGVGYIPLTARPINQTEFLDTTTVPGETFYYCVTAVEHSGLESGLSAEVAAGSMDPSSRHIFIDLDDAQLNSDFWFAFHGRANHLRYVWMRKRNAEGRAIVPLAGLEQPMKSPAITWCRVKGLEGVQFNIAAAGGNATVRSPPIDDWVWTRAEPMLDLANASQLVLSSRHYGSAIDQICLTTDASFVPGRSPRIAVPRLPAPTGLSVEAVAPYAVRLHWQPIDDPLLSHYNLYCSTVEEFAPEQSVLVASPDQPAMLDWALKAGRQYYYLLTCVDRFGRESTPGPVRAVQTPAIRPVHIERDFAARLQFVVPLADMYAIWLLLKKVGDDRGYINVTCFQIGSSTPVPGGGSWVGDMDGLTDSSWLCYDCWGRLILQPGPHRLDITNKTGSRIEKVIVTNDLSYVPSGHVNILRGW